MMKRLALALALTLTPLVAWGQCTGVFPANTLCGNLSGAPQPPAAFSASGTIVGPASSTANGLPKWGNSSGTLLQDAAGTTINGAYTWANNQTWSGTATFNALANFTSTFQVGGATKTFPAGAVTLGGLSTTQTWTGTNTFTGPINLSATTVVSGTATFGGDARFGGQPWIDVKSGTHGCAVATGDGVTNDTAAIQCYIDYMSTTYSGGTVFFPKGVYVVAGGGVTVPAGVFLTGMGAHNTFVNAITDSTAITFAISAGACTGGFHNGGLERLQVQGLTSVSATTPAVVIGSNCNVIVRDSRILYGKFGIQNFGVDSRVSDTWVWGYTAALSSTGANWYSRVAFDQPGPDAATYGIYISEPISPLVTAENHFSQVDVSGSYTESLHIDDGGGNHNVTVFQGSVFSSPVNIVRARMTMFTGMEFGSTSFSISGTSSAAIVGSYGFSPITISGTSTRSCAGNINITC